ncbi:DUF2066 domain-containing protein [Frateuria defendens]|uniref:DUF2066 domain-containing protein n=1 Tax=Frateuria defendens TaxID=2219559 RepID=UPI000AD56A0B|nr:DUF2066 domain-containing protein [Frateuria defendens]
MPMRLPRLLLALLVLGLAVVAPLHAQGQSSPYTVILPVTDTSEAQRDAAFADGLAQVLARVAGGQDLRSKPGYADALKGAPGMVQQYQYQRAGTGLALQASFDQGAVRQLIAKLGVAGAGAKPPVLAVVQGSDEGVLGRDSLEALAQAVAARGGTVVYPDPARAPDAKKLAAGDPATLAAVTQQYKTGLILVGKLQGGSGDWTLVSGGQPQHWTAQGVSEDAMLADAGNALADRLGRQLNVIGSTVNDGKLWVGDLRSAMDYAALLSTLRADPTVRQVTTLSAQDDGMLFAVKASVPLPVLAANLAAGGRAIQGGKRDGADASLRWLH